jgi:hypothetical protein
MRDSFPSPVCRKSAHSRDGLNEVPVMSHRDLFGPAAKVDELADQPTGNRVRVGAHTNGGSAFGRW